MSEKKVGKRLLTWVLVLIMALSMLPLNVLADEDGAEMTRRSTATMTTAVAGLEDGGTGTASDHRRCRALIPSARPLCVSAPRQTTPMRSRCKLQLHSVHHDPDPATTQAATVLVIDTSGSMGEGCQRWHIHNSSCPSRLKDAKTAAINFLNSYKAGGDGRYVALVRFSTGATVAAGWQDVSTPDGYTAILNALDGLSADGGTNLEQGLVNAQNLFNDSTVSVIPAKHVVALTDGEPTYYGPGPDGGNGQYCNQATFDATNDAATNL